MRGMVRTTVAMQCSPTHLSFHGCMSALPLSEEGQTGMAAKLLSPDPCLGKQLARFST